MLWLLIVLTPLFALALSVQAVGNPPAKSLYQSSPLSPLAAPFSSPLTAPVVAKARSSTALENNHVSIYLVGIVLMSMLAVVMVVWRRR